MTLKEMYIKNFQKRKAVIVYMADEAGRLTSHWAIPDKTDNTVRLLGAEKAIVLHHDKMVLSTKHNIPTYIVHNSNCEPVDLQDVQKGIYGAAEFEMILNNDMAEKIFKASTRSKITDEGKIIIGVVLLAVVALGYFMNTKFEDLKTALEPEPTPIVVVEDYPNAVVDPDITGVIPSE